MTDLPFSASHDIHLHLYEAQGGLEGEGGQEDVDRFVSSQDHLAHFLPFEHSSSPQVSWSFAVRAPKVEESLVLITSFHNLRLYFVEGSIRYNFPQFVA